MARLLRLNRKTIVRKLLFLGHQSQLRLDVTNCKAQPASVVEFDDLITIEHTKCKPLAVTVMVEQGSRRILGFEVARIPASGLLAKFARKKYGPRRDERRAARKRLFTRLQSHVALDAVIKSDEEPHYAACVRRYFPGRQHQQFKSTKSCVAGQGELKRRAFDPIFSINHTLAMLRANMSRLIRRSWCATKHPEYLAAHLAVYAAYHNDELLKAKPSRV